MTEGMERIECYIKESKVVSLLARFLTRSTITRTAWLCKSTRSPRLTIWSGEVTTYINDRERLVEKECMA